MDFRRLGQSDLHIAPLMLGTNVFGWNVDQATSFAILDAFVDAGFNAIDTANTYSRWVPGHQGGEAETIIGNWLKKSAKRDKAVIATKVGEDMGQGRGLKTSDILREAENSLRRLQTDRIDLYQTHFDDPNTAPDETIQAYAQLIAQGKVRAIGASNIGAARLQESLATSQRLGLARYESLQPRYNLYDRAAFERDFEPICLGSGSASSPTTRSPPVFSPANIVRIAISGKARRARHASRTFSTRAALVSCRHLMTWAPATPRRRRKCRWPG